jgi:hypothetical protein
VPLARHQRLVAGVAQQLGQRDDTVVQIALIARRPLEAGDRHLEHGADARDMMIGAGHQHRPGRRAGRGGMEIGEPQPGIGQPVEIGRMDFTAERSDIGKSQIVGDDHQKIGPFRHSVVLRWKRLPPRPARR